MPGSSPHARGTLCRFAKCPILRGIIPACAGNTLSNRADVIVIWDHPRMRGEHMSCSDTMMPILGSSPHARGTPVACWLVVAAEGIIPACAGNTIIQRQSDLQVRDHPRMRGEHRPVLRSHRRVTGSSPHARGTLQSCSLQCSSMGIIPACAGNTLRSVGSRVLSRDHPRMRGEHPVALNMSPS
ncbi:hypothetical protein BBOU_0617 [Bifidobacterium boum]|uniref:Uncharacterized protein n=1 Tax=Bifidobacterium boum TaxID=78343 RepID=A0A086ZPN8_9BIFI|nr:hypothetical protein BBOU_0617 [Bifidobacterium boum]